MSGCTIDIENRVARLRENYSKIWLVAEIRKPGIGTCIVLQNTRDFAWCSCMLSNIFFFCFLLFWNCGQERCLIVKVFALQSSYGHIFFWWKLVSNEVGMSCLDMRRRYFFSVLGFGSHVISFIFIFNILVNNSVLQIMWPAHLNYLVRLVQTPGHQCCYFHQRVCRLRWIFLQYYVFSLIMPALFLDFWNFFHYLYLNFQIWF